MRVQSDLQRTSLAAVLTTRLGVKSGSRETDLEVTAKLQGIGDSGLA